MIRNYTISRQLPKLRVEVLITLLGILGVLTFFAFYESAFPDASVDVSISRAQATQIATKYLKQFGYSAEGYQFAIDFSSDAHAAYYLQRTLGVEEYNTRLLQEQWPIYCWSARWFKPEEKEEFYVYLTPEGKLLGWNHIIKEEMPGPSLSQADAQNRVERFLANHVNWQSGEWELVESSSQTKPGGRVDHTFTWKSNRFSAGESELRYTAVVHGDQVGHMIPFIKVPESFTRQYSSERNVAGFINTGAYFTIILGCALISFIAISSSRPDVSRVVIPTLLVAGVTSAAYLNFVPLYKSSYITTQNYSLFWIIIVIRVVFSIIFYTVQAFILLVGAQSLSKFIWPRQDRILARGTDLWIRFSRSAWRGLMLGGVQMGYVVLFYMISTNYFGWWSPVTSEYSDIFATPFPFFYAFEVGLNAAVIEELSIRFLGFGFFLWMFRGRYQWLAVLIPSLVWAFAHTDYVTFPIYARGVELTVVALFLSFIFLKFDLLTTIMSHFTYNMMLVAMILLRSNEGYYQFSGWVVVLALALPLLPGLYSAIRQRLHKEPSPPRDLILSPLGKSDLEQLFTLPVRADWHALANQADRMTLCLRADAEVVGFVTGFIDDKRLGYIDGIYISPKWRRQYWGTTLLDVMHERLKSCGASEVRITVKPNENSTMSFLHNLFWRPSIHVLNKDESEQTLKFVLRAAFSDLRMEKPGEHEIQIPRHLI